MDTYASANQSINEDGITQWSININLNGLTKDEFLKYRDLIKTTFGVVI